MIRVGVNGFGVIGRRVADAISKQPDMELVGIGKTKPDYKAHLAAEKGYRIYVPEEKNLKAFSEYGLKTEGTTLNMIQESDIIIDSTPDGVGTTTKNLYKGANKPALFQGGEEHGIGEMSFVAQCNYDQARGKQFVRVVSCNTTGLCRAMKALDDGFGVTRSRVIIARRGADPDEPKKGPIDAVVLDPVEIPSHHGSDVKTVLPNLDIITMAMKIPTTHMHLHSLIVTLRDKGITPDGIIGALREAPRVRLVSAREGIKSTAHAMDYARELGRNRCDMYENVIWRDSITVIDGEAYFFMGIHQESIAIPENVDAVRAVLGTSSREESMAITNRVLGIQE